MKIRIPPQEELAPSMRGRIGRRREPRYGRTFEELRTGDTREHPRGFTVRASDLRGFATAFHQANPLHLNAEHARNLGFRDCPAPAQMVFNVTLSLGVENDSEAAAANLGYANAAFLRPVYPGDTLRAFTRVTGRRDRGEGRPGVVSLRTSSVNQWNLVVAQFERSILVERRGPDRDGAADGGPFPWEEAPEIELEEPLDPGASPLTGAAPCFEDLRSADVFLHGVGRSVTEEHFGWTYRLGNTHPLHFDRLYSRAQKGALSGEPVVYGGLVFAWLEGLASRDLTQNAVWDLGFTEAYHTQPTFAGDTLTAASRVLATVPVDEHFGLVTLQLVGFKNVTASRALRQWGAEVFVKEASKTRETRIPEKVFECERRVLLRRR